MGGASTPEPALVSPVLSLDAGAAAASLALAAGLTVSLLLERLVQPQPLPWRRRAPGSLMLHAGLWVFLHGLLILLLGRPWFALVVLVSGLLLLLFVNHAKLRALREPFIFQDHEYFLDMLRHPRLYVPFFGWGKAIAGALAFAAAVVAGVWLEALPPRRWALDGQSGAVLVALAAGAALVLAGHRRQPEPTCDPGADLRDCGLLASLWSYGCAERRPVRVRTPFETLRPPAAGTVLPHLVAVQSESFFDPRRWFSMVRPEVLERFDTLRATARQHGRLAVPAWGANTVRSEFAFLTGLPESALGVHRFNPYRILGRSGPETLASHLRRLGYRTVCIHPYPASFYLRDRVFPALGFDTFVDVTAFTPDDRSGPYVGDAAVARRVQAELAAADGPVFVYVITMENHGPLHLEQASAAEAAALLDPMPPAGCDDLVVYLRHLRNADAMAEALARTLSAAHRPASLCWFGDHVPIMPGVYASLGTPDGDTDYLVWHTRTGAAPVERRVSADELACQWLGHAGLLPDRSGV